MNEIVSQFAIQGNVVEALLPFGCGLACAFWCDAQAEGVHLHGLLCGYVRHALMPVSVHGYAAQPSHHRSQWPEEPLLLHQEIALEPLGMAIEHAHHKVPVACVRSQGYDVFLGEVFGNLFRETHPAEEYSMADVHSWIGEGECLVFSV